MALQRLAAELVARSHGLQRGHIGAVCDAIRAAGIDPTAVTAAQICAAMDADMRETGWYWPDRVDRPGGFLAHRLRRVSARLDALTRASSDGGFAAAGSPEEEVLQRPADPAVRAAVIAQTCEALRHRRIAGTTHPVVSLKGTPAEPDWESDCAVCGAPEAPRRPYARRSRSPHVCDACWAVAGEADTGAEGAAGVPVLA